jgi:TonB family protein
MPEAVLDQSQSSTPLPQLLVELPSRHEVFFGNLRDMVSPQPVPPLEIRSAPAPFWPDVFVERRLPWSMFVESGVAHLIAIVLVVAGTRFVALQPRATLRPLDRSHAVVYEPAAYLPPLDTRTERPARPVKADPEYSRQPVISVPREAENRRQTIVTPPSVRLKRDLALPDIVAWSDKVEKPKLAIPDAPLTLAADLTRLAPTMENAVVRPPPDATRLTQRRDQPNLQTAVVAPPPSLESASARRLGDLNVGHSSVIAPAPQLSVAEQRTSPLRQPRGTAPSAQVVPPPPSVSAPGVSGQSFGTRGRVVALNLHPAVGAPPDPPAGNRRGTFAATPEGHPGASGAPGSEPVAAKKRTNDLPAGLYVGSAAGAKTSPAAGASPAATNSVSPKLMASLHSNAARPTANTAQPGAASLTAAEREVFGSRKFYSMMLNMPNLNSAGGSWIIRFAEMKQDSNSPAADLSQPIATRKVDPAYPMQLMQENVAGTVIVYGVIHADGTVGNVRILRGVDSRIDQFASQAVSQWRFQPATKNGTPIDVEATFQIPFHPARPKSDY